MLSGSELDLVLFSAVFGTHYRVPSAANSLFTLLFALLVAAHAATGAASFLASSVACALGVAAALALLRARVFHTPAEQLPKEIGTLCERMPAFGGSLGELHACLFSSGWAYCALVGPVTAIALARFLGLYVPETDASVGDMLALATWLCAWTLCQFYDPSLGSRGQIAYHLCWLLVTLAAFAASCLAKRWRYITPLAGTAVALLCAWLSSGRGEAGESVRRALWDFRVELDRHDADQMGLY